MSREIPQSISVDPTNMKIVLITGAGGFLGSNVAARFKLHGYGVIGVGSPPRHRETSQIDEWHIGTLSPRLLDDISVVPDCVVHCAGGALVRQTQEAPLEDYERTVAGAVYVLDYLRRKAPGARLILASSAAVYGASEKMPITEATALRPISLYGRYKKAVEEIAAGYAETYGFGMFGVRFFSLYGAGLRKQLLWDACEKFRAGRFDFGGSGNETRDWIHVRDAADLIFCLAQTDGQRGATFINGSTGVSIRVSAILRLLERQFFEESRLSFSQFSRPGDPLDYCGDAKLSHSLGWAPAIAVEQGVIEYAKWYKDQKHG